MKLKNISVENYRFFKENQPFDFIKDNKPQNILLYGENGSGKTSLYNALKDFFFYYKNPSESKTKIKENKNIFAESTDKIKIEITFENDTNIKFTETGFDKEDLKNKIKQVSKSKLFLTYQDIYNLNNMFKKDISYKEFKEIFTILYFDDLNHLFNEFEADLDNLIPKIQDMDTLVKDYSNIKKLIEDFDETFTYELKPIEKVDSIDKGIIPNVYDTVFYLDDSIILKLEENTLFIKTFFDIFEQVFDLESMELMSQEFDSFDLLTKYEEIVENIKRFTKENDRYNDEQITVVDEQINDNNTYIDTFSSKLIEHSILSYGFLKCEDTSKKINTKIYNNLNSSLEKINHILDFLDINIKIEKIIEKPFIDFNFNYITKKENIRSIDFKILLAGKELKKHWSNLNEAKLSALNFAIYLSSVLQKKPDIPILVLDDLLISLDMSNRDKIVELLLDRTKNEDGNYNYFDDKYQMFIFTHDKAFFENAKQIFDYKAKNKWNYFEMYVDIEKDKNFEIPYIKTYNQQYGNIERAIEHFKNRDYPACANYLRKEVEKIFNKELKLDNLDEKIKLLKLRENEHLIYEVGKNLKNVIEVLKQFRHCSRMPENIQIEKCNLFAEQVITTIEEMRKYIEDDFHFEEFEDVKLILKSILHPQSHNDITKPLYKKELEDAIELMEEFNNIIEENR